MVAALITAVEEHGWQTETIPLFPTPEPTAAPPATSQDDEVHHFDHDDPVEFISPRSAS
jgi:hypothetical protein